MGNIEGWRGPMPQSQIDSRKKLAQKMLKRMKSLGIEPLTPGSYGMVPSNLKNKSKAHIIPQGTWGAFTRPDILDPMDQSSIVLQPSFMTKPAVCTVRTFVSSPATLFMREELRTA